MRSVTFGSDVESAAVRPVAVAFPSFLTVLPLLRAGRTACWLAAGLMAAIGAVEYSFGGLYLLPAAALLAWVGRALDA